MENSFSHVFVMSRKYGLLNLESPCTSLNIHSMRIFYYRKEVDETRLSSLTRFEWYPNQTWTVGGESSRQLKDRHQEERVKRATN